jgi:lysozyme
MLTNDIGWYETQAMTFPWYASLDPVRATVVCTMIFNMGLRTFSQFHDTIGCIQRGDWEGAAANMMASAWARQVGARAERLADMMRLGVPIER